MGASSRPSATTSMTRCVGERSLRFCAGFIEQNIETLGQFYGRTETCNKAAAQLCAMVKDTTMEAIFANGLHEFLTEFIARNNEVSNSLSESYNFY